MRDSGDRPDSHIFVKEFWRGEISEDFAIVNAVVIFLTLSKRVKLSDDHSVHALEHIDEIFWLLLEQWVFGQCSKLLIATSRPILNLIIDNVDLLESFSDVSVGLIDSCQILVHLNELGIITVNGRSIVISGINLQLLKSFRQLLVILLQAVTLRLTGRNSLEKCRVRLLTDLEAANHGLDIGHSSMRLDLLESIINGT